MALPWSGDGPATRVGAGRLRSRAIAPPGRLVALLALLCAAAPVVVYLWLASHRLDYPYELDWLEGGTVELVDRIVHGHGLYSPPSFGYVGFTYTPLFSYVSAAVAELTGVGFLPLRIVSFASSLVVMAVLAAYVRDVAGSWIAGALSAGLFAACYGIAGDSFDVGRLDSMFLALALLALWLGRRSGSVRAGIAVGVVAFLAFFTKQIALVTIVPALVAALALRPRPAVAALVTLVVLAGASTLLIDAATDNWYRYYIISELTGQPEIKPLLVGYWQHDLLGKFPELAGLTAAALLAAALTARRRRPTRHGLGTVAYDLAALGGLWVTAWISTVHSGGWLNVLTPGFAGVAAVAGVAFAALWRRGTLAALVACGLVIWQLTGLLAGSGVALPTRADRVGGAELLSALRRLPGPVLVLRHPWYGTEAGKGSFAQADGIAEVLRSDGARGATYLTRHLHDALDRYGIRAVVLDSGESPPSWLAPQLAAQFHRVAGDLTQVPLRPPTDIQCAPETLYLRNAH